VNWLPQDALDEQYRAADVLLFPSLRDSGGMVVLEALAHGVPVLCTDLGGPGLIVNASCGRTMTTLGRSPQQLANEIADTIIEMIDAPLLRHNLSRGAKLRAREFNFSNLVQSIYPNSVSRPVARKA
jgi:glycosyltransferase involved in cell wall biosynthesis